MTLSAKSLAKTAACALGTTRPVVVVLSSSCLVPRDHFRTGCCFETKRDGMEWNTEREGTERTETE